MEDESLILSFQKKRQRSCMKEKIIFLIDKHNTMKISEGWCNNDENNITILDSIISYVEVFIKRKLKTFYKHEIAIVSFDEKKVTLHNDFTSNDKSLINNLKNINDNDNDDNVININEENNLNEIIDHTINILRLDNNNNTMNVRFILLYGRDQCPLINEDNIPLFLLNHWVYFDILYLHSKVTKEEPEDTTTNFQEIFDILATFQQIISESHRKSSSDNDNNNSNKESDNDIHIEEKINYIFDSHNSSLRINTYIAALLAHSAIRDMQNEMLQKLDRKTIY